MSSLTLVRHGQASYMSMDYDRLSSLGEEQAVRLGQYWVKHGISFDRIFHGPAQRHIRTMAIAGEVVKSAGLPWPEPVAIPDFDEFDAFTMMRLVMPLLVAKHQHIRELNADFEANRETVEAGRKLQKLFEAAATQWAIDGIELEQCESWSQFRRRIASAVDQLRSTAAQSSSSVVFTSSGPIAATLAHVLNLSDAKAIEFVWLSRNGSYSQFLFSGERFSMHSFNSVGHLSELSLLTYR